MRIPQSIGRCRFPFAKARAGSRARPSEGGAGTGRSRQGASAAARRTSKPSGPPRAHAPRVSSGAAAAAPQLRPPSLQRWSGRGLRTSRRPLLPQRAGARLVRRGPRQQPSPALCVEAGRRAASTCCSGARPRMQPGGELWPGSGTIVGACRAMGDHDPTLAALLHQLVFLDGATRRRCTLGWRRAARLLVAGVRRALRADDRDDDDTTHAGSRRSRRRRRRSRRRGSS